MKNNGISYIFPQDLAIDLYSLPKTATQDSTGVVGSGTTFAEGMIARLFKVDEDENPAPDQRQDRLAR